MTARTMIQNNQAKKMPRNNSDARLLLGRRVGVAGATGSGKTCFAKYLGQTRCVAVHDEGVREWMAENSFATFQEIDEVSFSEMHLHLLRRYRNSTCAVFDRTPADLYYYASQRAQLLDLGKLESICRELLNSFDVVVFFPFYARYFTSDPARIMDPAEQIRAAGAIMNIITTWGFIDRTIIFDHERGHASNAHNVFNALRTSQRRNSTV